MTRTAPAHLLTVHAMQWYSANVPYMSCNGTALPARVLQPVYFTVVHLQQKQAHSGASTTLYHHGGQQGSSTRTTVQQK